MIDSRAVIFDLDGTLADDTHRQHLICEAPDFKRLLPNPQWEEYFFLCGSDSPIIPMVRLCKLYFWSGYEVLIWTGRSELVHEHTVEWLKRHKIYYDSLKMRSLDDKVTPNWKLKLGWYKQLEEDLIVECAFDDCNKITKMWRDVGVHCCQVGDTDTSQEEETRK